MIYAIGNLNVELSEIICAGTTEEFVVMSESYKEKTGKHCFEILFKNGHSKTCYISSNELEKYQIFIGYLQNESIK